MDELDSIKDQIRKENLQKSKRIFELGFLKWVETIHSIQRDNLDVYEVLKEIHEDNTPVAEWFWVNGVGYWLGLADIARNLYLLAESISSDCNRRSGYKIDSGELQDVLDQIRQYNNRD